jgi:hypothetical protein
VFSAIAPALLNHRDVAAAIAPGNLAAFPPSLEVNAAYARSGFLPTSCITHRDVGNAEK